MAFQAVYVLPLPCNEVTRAVRLFVAAKQANSPGALQPLFLEVPLVVSNCFLDNAEICQRQLPGIPNIYAVTQGFVVPTEGSNLQILLSCKRNASSAIYDVYSLRLPAAAPFNINSAASRHPPGSTAGSRHPPGSTAASRLPPLRFEHCDLHMKDLTGAIGPHVFAGTKSAKKLPYMEASQLLKGQGGGVAETPGPMKVEGKLGSLIAQTYRVLPAGENYAVAAISLSVYIAAVCFLYWDVATRQWHYCSVRKLGQPKPLIKPLVVEENENKGQVVAAPDGSVVLAFGHSNGRVQIIKVLDKYEGQLVVDMMEKALPLWSGVDVAVVSPAGGFAMLQGHNRKSEVLFAAMHLGNGEVLDLMDTEYFKSISRACSGQPALMTCTDERIVLIRPDCHMYLINPEDIAGMFEDRSMPELAPQPTASRQVHTGAATNETPVNSRAPSGRPRRASSRTTQSPSSAEERGTAESDPRDRRRTRARSSALQHTSTMQRTSLQENTTGRSKRSRGWPDEGHGNVLVARGLRSVRGKGANALEAGRYLCERSQAEQPLSRDEVGGRWDGHASNRGEADGVLDADAEDVQDGDKDDDMPSQDEADGGRRGSDDAYVDEEEGKDVDVRSRGDEHWVLPDADAEAGKDDGAHCLNEAYGAVRSHSRAEEELGRAGPDGAGQHTEYEYSQDRNWDEKHSEAGRAQAHLHTQSQDEVGIIPQSIVHIKAGMDEPTCSQGQVNEVVHVRVQQQVCMHSHKDRQQGTDIGQLNMVQEGADGDVVLNDQGESHMGAHGCTHRPCEQQAGLCEHSAGHEPPGCEESNRDVASSRHASRPKFREGLHTNVVFARTQEHAADMEATSPRLRADADKATTSRRSVREADVATTSRRSPEGAVGELASSKNQGGAGGFVSSPTPEEAGPKDGCVPRHATTHSPAHTPSHATNFATHVHVPTLIPTHTPTPFCSHTPTSVPTHTPTYTPTHSPACTHIHTPTHTPTHAGQAPVECHQDNDSADQQHLSEVNGMEPDRGMCGQADSPPGTNGFGSSAQVASAELAMTVHQHSSPTLEVACPQRAGGANGPANGAQETLSLEGETPRRRQTGEETPGDSPGSKRSRSQSVALTSVNTYIQQVRASTASIQLLWDAEIEERLRLEEEHKQCTHDLHRLKEENAILQQDMRELQEDRSRLQEDNKKLQEVQRQLLEHNRKVSLELLELKRARGTSQAPRRPPEGVRGGAAGAATRTSQLAKGRERSSR